MHGRTPEKLCGREGGSANAASGQQIVELRMPRGIATTKEQRGTTLRPLARVASSASSREAMPRLRDRGGTSVCVKVITPSAKSVIGERRDAFGVGLKAGERGVVADGRGHGRPCRVGRAEAKPRSGWADRRKSAMRLERAGNDRPYRSDQAGLRRISRERPRRPDPHAQPRAAARAGALSGWATSDRR